MSHSVAWAASFHSLLLYAHEWGLTCLQGMHAGAIRAFLYNNAQLETPYNVTVADLTHAIAELRDTVGGVTTSAAFPSF